MIEIKDKEIKIAENREEKVLYKFLTELDLEIKQINDRIKEDEKVLEMNKNELYKKTQEGIKKEIEILKDNIFIKELIKNEIKNRIEKFNVKKF